MTENTKCGIIKIIFWNQLTAEDVGSFLFFVDALKREYCRRIGINAEIGGTYIVIPILLFILGLVLLIKGGDWFVDSASEIAKMLRIPDILIGATIVSVGTTLPEVMVSATSAFSGHGEMAYGNAIGSIICNTALIAALTVAIRPARIEPRSFSLHVIVFFIAAAVYVAVAYVGEL